MGQNGSTPGSYGTDPEVNPALDNRGDQAAQIGRDDGLSGKFTRGAPMARKSLRQAHGLMRKQERRAPSRFPSRQP